MLCTVTLGSTFDALCCGVEDPLLSSSSIIGSLDSLFDSVLFFKLIFSF